VQFPLSFEVPAFFSPKKVARRTEERGMGNTFSNTAPESKIRKNPGFSWNKFGSLPENRTLKLSLLTP
jgi:hypothetical protein